MGTIDGLGYGIQALGIYHGSLALEMVIGDDA